MPYKAQPDLPLHLLYCLSPSASMCPSNRQVSSGLRTFALAETTSLGYLPPEI